MAISDKALAGKVALVTGGSRGIGRAICIALGRRGAKVVVAYQSREDAAHEVAREVEAAGGAALTLQLDMGDAAAVEAAVKDVTQKAGGLDIVVNNAAISIDGLLLRFKSDDWQKTLNVNLTGVFALCKAASRSLLRAQGGRIINLTSVVGESGSAGQVAYTAAKAGVIGLTKTLARELASRAVTVNAVSPGFIDTDMTQSAIQGEARDQLIASIPLARIGTPDDVADVVAFLAGPEAAYITGQVIRVNGGLLM